VKKVVQARHKKKKSSKKSSSSNSSKSSNSDVVQLTGTTFYEEVRDSKDLWLVEFYAPWCGHCKALEPEWEEAATQLKGMARVAKVDATEEQALAGDHDVTGYPSIKVYKPKSTTFEDYQGERKADAIIDFAMEVLEDSGLGPQVNQLTSQEVFDEQCSGKKICVVGILPSIYDTGKEGRNGYISMMKSVSKKVFYFHSFFVIL